MPEGLVMRLREHGQASVLAYLFVQAVLLTAIAVLSDGASWLAVLASQAVGAGALAVGVARRRPEPRAAWWLLVTGAVAFTVGNVSGLLVIPFPGVPIRWLPVLVVVLAYPPFIAGLTVLARLGGRLDGAATVDALLLASTVYLVMFGAVIRPNLGSGPDAFLSVAAPLGALIVMAMAIRAAFAGSVRSWSVGLVLAALAARASGTVTLVVPAIATGRFERIHSSNVVAVPAFSHGLDPVASPVIVLWSVYGVLIGVAGLHPSLARVRPEPDLRDRTTPMRRMVLTATLAVAVIYGSLFMLEIERGFYSEAGREVSFGLAGVLLVLLVVRLSLGGVYAGRQRETMLRRIEHGATHDEVTGLLNRSALISRMESAVTHGHGPQTLALMSVDSLNNANEIYGHAVGDELLVQVSHRLSDALPEDSTLARLSSDEFGVLLKNTPENVAVAWGMNILESVGGGPYRVADLDLFVSASVGLRTAPADSESLAPADFLRNADLALEDARASGGDRVSAFRAEVESARRNRTRLATGLQRAIANDELSVAYQPIWDLRTSRIVAVESLLRWTPLGAAVPRWTSFPLPRRPALFGQSEPGFCDGAAGPRDVGMTSMGSWWP
jgi:diguanylate cyclase (GGDEF)-like protein